MKWKVSQLSRAGLSDNPINGYKGYYGHTMGAAGVLESILSMKALDNGLILPTRGFDEIGVTHPVNISNQNRHTDKKTFIKLLSGFGGCNVAMLFSKG
jgi:3-oxoacyl-[acyl-carrier-protein] synthase-1